jgi:hypothetical protein
VEAPAAELNLTPDNQQDWTQVEHGTFNSRVARMQDLQQTLNEQQANKPENRDRQVHAKPGLTTDPDKDDDYPERTE